MRRHGNGPDETSANPVASRPREAIVNWYAESDSSEIPRYAIQYAKRRKPSDYDCTLNSTFDNFYRCGSQSTYGYAERTIATGIADWQPGGAVLEIGCIGK